MMLVPIFAALAVHIVAPSADAPQPLLRPLQRRVASAPADKQTNMFADRALMMKMFAEGGRPAPVVLQWEATDCPDAFPRAFVTVRRLPDEKEVFSGISVTNSICVDNLEIGREYAWRVTVRSRGAEASAEGRFSTEDLPPRLMRVDGVPNVRDIGGWRGLGGRRVRQGLIYRSAGWNDNATSKTEPGAARLTEDARAEAEKTLGIVTDVDLRGKNERYGMEGSPIGPGVRLVTTSPCIRSYVNITGEISCAALKVILPTFLPPDPKNFPAVFHCIAGADRTGNLAYILGGLLGVSPSDLTCDYCFTAFSRSIWNPWNTGKGYDENGRPNPISFDRTRAAIGSFPGATENERIEGFVKSLGFTYADIAAFRDFMLEPVAAGGASAAVTTAAPVKRAACVSPSETTVDGESVEFTWTAGPRLASYSLYVSPSPDFAPVVLREIAVTGTSAVVTGLYADKTYWWTVLTKNAKGRVIARAFPAHFRTAPRKDGRAGDGKARRSLLPDDCYQDDLPTVDIAGDKWRQAILADGTDETYYGHAYTALGPDRHTVWAMFTRGTDHALASPGPLARTTDGGRTWERLDERIPMSLPERHQGSPILRALVKPDGSTRYIIFSRSPKGKLVTTVSDDLGETWRDGSEFPIPTGMGPTGFITLKDGRTALFGQTIGTPMDNIPENTPKNIRRYMVDRSIWMSVTTDGGDTWSEPRIVASAPRKNLCEPFCVRSKDGGRLALVIREQTRSGRSMVCFSRDDGETWTKPIDTPWGLTGDRHEGVCLSDGRLLIAFRDQAPGSYMSGQYVAWVGTWEDLEKCRPGQYRIHLLQHYPDKRRGWSSYDCGYSGVHELKDGTIVCTTYLKNAPDGRRHSVMSTHFKIGETDALLKQMQAKAQGTKGE